MGPAQKLDEYYTYADYAQWTGDERYELIDGVPYLMSPAPTPMHQSILRTLVTEFSVYFRDKTCEVYMAPIDVRLNADSYDDTVVQPDMLVVCDKEKIDKKGINGAPDLVIEILSPSSASYDSGLKLQKYIESGVHECWIVDPTEKIINVYLQQSDKSASMHAYSASDTIKVTTLNGLTIHLDDVFPD
jgi:Uma2 family endonuclease